MIKKYYSLTKPGIIFGNLITVAGGFFLASKGNFHFILFIATLLGISLVIASGCVFNNVIDQDIDKIMERTKNRVLVKGLIAEKTALLFGIILGIAGTYVLYRYTNILTVEIALLGLFVYVVVYSLWLKRSSIYGTLIGSISGSVPPVAGYCAVTNRFDLGAVILFLILSFWQMPHSYAIAIYRLNDYTAAGIPVLPVKRGIYLTKINMLAFVFAFIVATMLLTIFDYTGFIYLTVVGLLGLRWLWLAISGFTHLDDKKWARKMFMFSIIIITVLSVMMAADYNTAVKF